MQTIFIQIYRSQFLLPNLPDVGRQAVLST